MSGTDSVGAGDKQPHERCHVNGSLHHDLLARLDIHPLANNQVGISLELGFEVRHPGTSFLNG